MANDPYELARFVKAQDNRGTYDAAISELRREHKTSHWMWFVFPQIAGLGSSPTSRLYAISGLDEARAYLAHPVLGARLLEAAQTVLSAGTSSADEIFGAVDAQKLRSSATLFHRAAPDEAQFTAILDRFFGGVADSMTDQLL